MFVQIMEGRVAGRDRMKSLMEQWMDDLRPGAAGWLGSTVGVTSDGRAVAVARFESAAAAAANSSRPEQGAWWSEMEAVYDGDVHVSDSEDVGVFLTGGSNDAGFVQVMRIDEADRGVIDRLDEMFEAHARDSRPDLIGSLRVWAGPTTAYDISYFTSEAEAREGESKPFPPDLQALWPELEPMMATTEFFDLSDPWLF